MEGRQRKAKHKADGNRADSLRQKAGTCDVVAQVMRGCKSDVGSSQVLVQVKCKSMPVRPRTNLYWTPVLFIKTNKKT